MKKKKINHTEMIKRLDGFYGAVCQNQNQYIAEKIIGEKILEVGCGYGTLLELLKRKGFQAIGIDMDKDAIQLGKLRYKNLDIIYMDGYNPEFYDEKFNCVIFRESAHHLDLDAVFTKLEKVIKEQVIIFEPNPNLLVRLCRKLIGHIDPELDYRNTLEVFKKHNFNLDFLGFRDVIAFPLSGGFVGKPLLPNIKFLWAILLKTDEILVKILDFTGLQRYFCWRYMAVATKNFSQK